MQLCGGGAFSAVGTASTKALRMRHDRYIQGGARRPEGLAGRKGCDSGSNGVLVRGG